MRTPSRVALGLVATLAIDCTSILGLPNVPAPPDAEVDDAAGASTGSATGSGTASVSGQSTASSGSGATSPASCAGPSVIAFDEVASANGLTTSSLTWTHFVGAGENPILFVSVASRTSAAPSAVVTGVSFGSAPLARVTSLAPAAFEYDDLELWSLEAPPAGSGTITVMLSESAEGASGASISYTGIRASNAVDVAASSSGMTGDPALGWMTGASGTWALAVAMVQGVSQFGVMIGPNQTVRYLVTDTSWEAQSGVDQASVSSPAMVTFGWTIPDKTEPWIAVGASFVPACP